jgi:hypothetical protein
MSWPQTLAICGSIFLAVGISREAAQAVGCLALVIAALWPVFINTRNEIHRRNREELERIKQMAHPEPKP